MLKSVLIVLSLSFLSFQIFQNDRYLDWRKDLKINRDDFKATPLFSVQETGAIMTVLDMRFHDTSGIKCMYLVAVMDRYKSWLRYSEGIQHEQTHFDITEIFARKFNNEMLSQKKLFKDPIAQFERYKAIQDEERQMQSNYDQATNHGIKDSIQLNWGKWVSKQLDSIPKIF